MLTACLPSIVAAQPARPDRAAGQPIQPIGPVQARPLVQPQQRRPPPTVWFPAYLPALIAVTAAAAAKRKRQQDEEDEMNPLESESAASFEYKIVRSGMGAFNNPAKFKAMLEEEARAGWELLEKLDGSRVRLKRSITCRQKDGELMQDPYRTTVGAGEGKIVLFVVLGIVVGIAVVVGIIALVVKA